MKLKKIKEFIEYVLALFIILNCQSVFKVALSKNYYINEVIIVCLSLLIILNIKKMKNNKKKTSMIIFLFFYYMFCIFFCFMNNVQTYTSFIEVFIIIFPMLYVLYMIDIDCRKRILLKILNVMSIIAIISIFFYFFGSILKIVPKFSWLKINWGMIMNIKSYFNLYFESQYINIFGLKIVRNCSVFCEAPMYSLNLILALSINEFIADKPSKLKKILLSIAIATTLSTTGIILGLGILIYSKIIKNESGYNKKILKLLSVPFIIVVAAIIILQFFSEKKNTSSYSTRMDDYNAIYSAWKESIIFGNGYNNDEIIKSHMSVFRKYNQGLSSSLVVLAHGGIYFSCLYILAFIIALMKSKKDKKLLGIVIVIVLLFFTTIFQYTVMLINFMAICYAMLQDKKGDFLE